MNRIAFGIVIGVLAVAALSPTTAPRIVTQLREAGEMIMDTWTNAEPGRRAPFYSNQALTRSITAERKELDNRVTAFNKWKAHKECNADTTEYRDFLRETGRNAPVIACD
ncbi:MAG: hypothetical protein WA733_25440 [Methylocystis sp.]